LKKRAAILLQVVATSLIAAPAPPSSTNTFTNPVVANGADPWVVQWQGQYYFCQSRRGGVWIAQTPRLTDLGTTNRVCVWRPPPDKPYSRELWAPELHYLRGRWYIYLAADDGDNANHRMYVLEGTTQNPQDPFVFRGQLTATPDRWAIDGTVLEMPDGRLYFLWSGWEGTNNVAQNLYLAPMSDPLTISGARVCLSRPEHDWEQHGRPLVNEGPEVLWHDGTLLVIYSASGSWGDDYCLGQLRWTGGDVMNPEAWQKKTVPVFAPTTAVHGPGHASFVKSRDGKEDWIVYHAAKRSGSGWDRNVRIQKFTWNADGSPNFGIPTPVGVPVTLPGGE
jgi:GH43 family beta-xylosidase